MDRYQRVEKPREETPINENEIRITAQGRMRSYITYATSLLQEKGSDEIVFKAMGRAINKTVMIVELIKRRIVGLHQNTEIGSTDITDTWEPLEEGLLPLETTRHVSMITITLSKEELDTSFPGYQLPLPKDQVEALGEFAYEGEDLHGGRGRGRGRGGHAQGRDRGNGFMAMDYGDEELDNRGYGRGGWNRGRGRGFRGGGGGRGYGGRTDYQQENGGYNEDYSVPVHRRGFRGGGRGYGGRTDYRQENVGYNDEYPVPVQRQGFRGGGRGYGGRSDYQQENGGYNNEYPVPVQRRGFRGGGRWYGGRTDYQQENGGGFRGGGRGYGGRTDYQQENGGYNEEYSVPVLRQGRGRGRGQGRGRGMG